MASKRDIVFGDESDIIRLSDNLVSVRFGLTTSVFEISKKHLNPGCTFSDNEGVTGIFLFERDGGESWGECRRLDN